MKNATFKNGDPIPQLGLGTWRSEPSEAYRAVKEALRIGYRHIDCAAIYGNEKEVGQALRDSFREGIVRREELFVTSKHSMSVVIIGGHDRMVCQYKKVCKQFNCKAKIFTQMSASRCV